MNTTNETLLEIPIGAKVYGRDGLLGRSVCLVIDPVADVVTDLVLQLKNETSREILVPVDHLKDTGPEQVKVDLSLEEVHELRPFKKTEFLDVEVPRWGISGSLVMWPYLAPEQHWVPQKVEMIPPGDPAIQRKTEVRAKDGRVGFVDEFMIEPVSGHITHLVMREGHLLGQHDVMIPVSAIQFVDEDIVWLSLTKQEVKDLPVIPLRHRRWQEKK